MATTTSREYFLNELRERRKKAEQDVRELGDRLTSVQGDFQAAQKRLEIILAMLAMESPEEAKSDMPKDVQQGYATMSVKEAVEQLLGETGRPMHAKEIMMALQRRGVDLSQKDPLATIVTVLVRGVRAGTYKRTAPNTFRRA